VEFSLPPSPGGNKWELIMNTEKMDDPFARSELDNSIIAGGRSFYLLTDARE